MYRIDTEKKLNLFLDELENGGIVIGGTNPTEQGFAEIGREINEYRAVSRRNRERAQTVLD